MGQALWQWYAKRGPRPWVAAIELRCRHYNALPFKGGIIDQPEELMSLLELVSTVKHYLDMDIKGLTELKPEEMQWYDILRGK